MKLTGIRELFSVRDLRNGLLGVIVVVGGIGLAAVTIYGHRTGNPRLAGFAAIISLVFVVLILIFVVPPLARNASKEASQLNLPFDFTLGGAIMLGLIMIVGFSAWNTGNNLLFLVLSFLTASVIVGFVAGSLCLKKLDVKMRFPETIFAGEAAPILVSIQNRKRLLPSISVVAEVRGNLRVESVAAADLRRLLPRFFADRMSRAPIVRRTLDYFVYIPHGRTSETRVMHVFPERCRFVIRDFEISTRFPFGFFRHRRRLPAKETELLVFPGIEPITSEMDDLPLETGKIAVNKRGSGQDLLALRDYLPNDDMRRVDWKATARASRLIVREFSAEDDKKITVLLDTRLPAEAFPDLTLREKIESEQDGTDNVFVSERFEAGVRVTASLLAHFSEAQAEIRLVIGGESSEFGVGSRHLHDCLKRLAIVEPVPAGDPVTEPLGSKIELPENGHIFVITAMEAVTFPFEIGQSPLVVHY
jgi:uncharacterized protein (DUF58 family)